MSQISGSIYTSLPKLPGFTFPELSQRPSYALSQTFVPVPGTNNCTIPRDITSLRMTTNHGSSKDPSKSIFTEAEILRKSPLRQPLHLQLEHVDEQIAQLGRGRAGQAGQG